MKTIRLSKNEKGAAGLEFTLLFPFLLFVCFGIIEFGALMFDKAILTNAAREGARYAITHAFEGGGPYLCSELENIRDDVEAYVEQYMGNYDDDRYFLIRFDNQTPIPTVDPPVQEPDSGEYVIPVRVAYTFNFLFIDHVVNLFSNGAAGGGITMEAEARMRGNDRDLFEWLADNCT